MDTRPIGVFDSGVGGLSVYRELKKLLPHEQVIYLCDQKNVPYGAKTKEQILSYTDQSMQFFLKRNVKLVVIACNTATIYAIDAMRERYPILFVGTVPMIKQLKNYTKTKKAAVLCTPATAKSEYLKKLIEEYADGIEVKVIGGSNLEQFVERGNLDNLRIYNLLVTLLNPLLEKNIDTLALSCTHYPFLRPQIAKIAGSRVHILDSGNAIARHTKEILRAGNLLSENGQKDLFYTTGDMKKFRIVAEELLGSTIEGEKAYV